MKKTINKFNLLLIIVLSVVLFNIPCIYAKSVNTPSTLEEYSQLGYVIDNYNVDIVVNENNSFSITEKISVCFNSPRHGIYRIFPLINEVTRQDGSISKNHPRITDVSVDAPYSTIKEDGEYLIKIGSENTLYTGIKTYTLKYNYAIGNDPIESIDEFYFNIIGDNWDAPIGNIYFTITMPKEFDHEKIGFSSGVHGSTRNDNIDFVVEDNTISGYYNGILKPYEALTIRLELPENYFTNADFPFDFCALLMWAVPIISIIISLCLLKAFGNFDTVIETVEFYPPENYNSLEVGFLYHGKSHVNHITSLIVYLANKGYLSITELNKQSKYGKGADFKLTRLKEYDGTNPSEKMFLEGLFKHSKNIDESGNPEVTSKDLNYKFYRTTNDILALFNTNRNKYKLFTKTSFSSLKALFFMLFACTITCNLPLLTTIGDTGQFMVCSVFLALLLAGVSMFLLKNSAFTKHFNSDAPSKTSTTITIFKVILIAICSLIYLYFVYPIMLDILDTPYYVYGYMAGIIANLIMILCLRYFPKRTYYGNEILGKLRGFKDFLETCEKDKLEALVFENPNYFFDILPFTYVLGVSDVWIKKFENINIQPPEWYNSYYDYNYITFNRFMTNTLNSANYIMNSVEPSTTSSSGSGHSFSSGGGFSGGGSGGGGGRSW